MSDASLLSSLRSSFTVGSSSDAPAPVPVAPAPYVPTANVTPPQTSTNAQTPTKKKLIIPQRYRDRIAKRKAEAAITTQDKLDALGTVLDEVEASTPSSQADSVVSQATSTVSPQVNVTPEPVEVPAEILAQAPLVAETPLDAVAQVVPQVTLQSTDTLNPAQATGSTIKESQTLPAVEVVAAEMGVSLQSAEQETNPELSPEVESFLQKVEENHDQAPQEIVLAGDTAQVPPTTHHPSQPVIVLPITPELEKKGAHANPHWSLRWLVEWSHKVIKMFTGKVIYNQA